MFGRAILAAAALFSLTSMASAATTHTYNFACPVSSCSYSVVKNFTPAGGGPALTVTSRTVSSDGNTISNITPGSGVGIGRWPTYGLGIRNGTGDNSHTVDGSGLNDLLELVFDTKVKIVSATFSYAGIITNSTDGFAFFADGGNDGSVAGDMVFSHQDIGANSSGFGTYNFTLDGFADIFSKTFAIAAIADQLCSRSVLSTCNIFDSFKLKSIVVERMPTVPLPAALPLLLAALLMTGALGRRRAKMRA